MRLAKQVLALLLFFPGLYLVVSNGLNVLGHLRANVYIPDPTRQDFGIGAVLLVAGILLHRNARRPGT